MQHTNITEIIGNTPLLRMHGLERHFNLKAQIFAKLEFFNPSGSVKDRIAYAMLKDALEKGEINKNTTIIEPTSGNTGISLAAVCAALGLNLVIVMPDTMTKERRTMLRGYGAKVVLTQGALGMKGSIEKATELKREIKNSYMPLQFVNTNNPDIHYKTTGYEIVNDLNGDVDYLVAGVGSGGTLSGTARYLKEKVSKVKIVAVEPYDSAFLSSGKSSFHRLYGIGLPGFIPKTLDTSLIDEVIDIKANDAFRMVQYAARFDGILPGISSGAALDAAVKLGKDPKNTNKKIVVILPDGGERYLSTPAFLPLELS